MLAPVPVEPMSRAVRTVGLLVAAVVAVSSCRDTPARPDPLRVGLHSAPLTLDPHLHDEAVTRSILGNLFEGLTAFDREMKIVPALAERWENPSDLVWRFHLRRGVTFHDGRPFAARDVVASLERALHHPGSKLSGYLVAVSGVRALADHTVEITTSRPYPILLNKLTFVPVVPAGSPPTISRPVGTGRYRFDGYEEGRVMRLRAHEAHLDGPPPHAAAELHFESDNHARLTRRLAGELDLVHEVAPQEAAATDAAEGHRLAARSGLLVLYLHLRVDRPPFDDPRVRRAVDLALDRRRLVRDMLAGQGTPATQMVSPQVFGYAPQLPATPYDPAAARRLLAEAGHAGGLELELEHRRGRNVGALVAQLAAVGFRVRPVARPWMEMYPRLAGGEVTLYLGGWSCASGDASDLFDSMVHSRDPLRGYGDSNFNGYASPQLDRLIEASATLDMQERRDTLHVAMRRLRDELPVVPLVVPYALYGVAEELLWEPRLDSRIFLWEAARGG